MASDSPRVRIDQFFASKKKRKTLSPASKSGRLEKEAKTQIDGSPCAKGSLQSYLVTSPRDDSPARSLSSASDHNVAKVTIKRNLNLDAGLSARDTNQRHLPRMGSHFSLGQWQELELQALIYRHMISGYAVPPDLLHLVKKSLISSAPPPPPPPSSVSPYYLSHPLHPYYPHYQPSLLQSGYWGRSAMDPEPGRCRRTDGKKWRCSRDVVAGQKYCERHMHRGRNRSRKPVEIPTSTAATTNPYGGGGGGESLKASHSVSNQGMVVSMAAGGGGSGQFTLSGPPPSMDLLHLNTRPPESIIDAKSPFEAQNRGQPNGDRTLRFFDDWPRSFHESESSVASATNLSISMPGNNPSSDFSLKLGTGNVDGGESTGGVATNVRDRPQLNWASTWDTNRAGPMGGPLAEALRSSTSNSSPTSVLHRLPRGTASETSFVSS